MNKTLLQLFRFLRSDLILTQFDFPYRARLFLHIAWNGISGEAGAEFFHHLAATVDGHLEVGGACNAVELVQVIGQHPQIDELFAERG